MRCRVRRMRDPAAAAAGAARSEKGCNKVRLVAASRKPVGAGGAQDCLAAAEFSMGGGA